MKYLLVLLQLVFSCSYVTAQLLGKAAPFTAVKWEQETPLVRFNDEWYYFEKLDSLNVEHILSFCKVRYGSRWKKRFSEDLVEVLKGMRYDVQVDVALTLRKDRMTKVFRCKMTESNRDDVRDYNDEVETMQRLDRTITKEQALEDLAQLQTLISERYSYKGYTGYNYEAAINAMGEHIGQEIAIRDLSIAVQKVLTPLGDGHSGVSGMSTILPAGYLPFVVKNFKGRVLCLDKNGKQLYRQGYPFLKSVNGVPADTLLKIAQYIVPSGSEQFVTGYCVYRLAFIRYMLGEAGALKGDQLNIVLQDSMGAVSEIETAISEKRFSLSRTNKENRLMEHNIGYIQVPVMTSSDKYIAMLEEVMEGYKTADGLIIDIRNNHGGSREILRTLAPYFLPASAAPVVVNVARYRTGDKQERLGGYLADRYLFPETYTGFDAQDQKTIHAFSKKFEPEWELPDEHYSKLHYMLVKPDSNKYYFSKAVVVLVNEACFSAADIFAAAFKELPGVTLLGKATGGGSGRTERYRLRTSGIEIKLSTMVSYQPNGQLYDHNGVQPDFEVREQLTDVTGETDTQLQKAVEIILQQ